MIIRNYAKFNSLFLEFHFSQDVSKEVRSVCLSQEVVLVWIVILFTNLVITLSSTTGTFLWFHEMNLVTLEEFLLDLVINLDFVTNLEVV